MRALVLAVALLAFAVPSRARADDDDDKPELQKMRFVERGANLHVTASIAKLFDRAAYEALDSGFSSTVLIRIWIYPKDGSDPVAFMGVTRQVLYNLWDEVYELKFDEPGGKKILKEKRKAEALKRLSSLDDLAVASLSALPYDRIFLLAMEIELNPVDPKLLAEVRRWLSQGTGGGLDRGGAFFGSFVSVFVNPKIAEADRVLRIRSQPFYRPKP
ncbi:MAG: hypothetical protein JNL83_13725 [Myxococcales bacterium]|nr:hypothetical protein [Myxococcales bacterium]